MILGSPLAEAHAVTVVKQREFVEAAGRPVVLIIGFYIWFSRLGLFLTNNWMRDIFLMGIIKYFGK